MVLVEDVSKSRSGAVQDLVGGFAAGGAEVWVGEGVVDDLLPVFEWFGG